MADYLEKIFGGEFMIIAYLVTVVLVFVLLMVLRLVILKALKSWVAKDQYELVDRLKSKIRLPFFLLIIFLSLTIPLSFFEQKVGIAGPLESVFSVMVIIFISWMLIQSVRLVKHFVLSRYDLEEQDNLTARKVFTQFRILENIVVFLIVIIALSLILMSFDSIRKIGVSLIASAGVAGIIIGFAAQSVIGTILAGIQIALTQPIRLDDVVIVENEWGRIEEINLTYVVVAIWDKRRLVLPTTYFIETPFQNWTRTSAEILGSVFIYADYTLPVDALREELDRILEKNQYWDGKVKVVQVTNTTEKTVEIRALMSAVDSGAAWNLRVHVREKLLAFLQEKYPDCLPRARLEISREDNTGLQV